MATVTIDNMIKKLEEIKAEHGGHKIIMFREPNGDNEVFAVTRVDYHVAEENEFPEDWDMPEGFGFVFLQV